LNHSFGTPGVLAKMGDKAWIETHPHAQAHSIELDGIGVLEELTNNFGQD
jgi:hypothetical protein